VVNHVLERIAMLRDRIQLDSLDIVGRFLKINRKHLGKKMDIIKDANRIQLREEYQAHRHA
jgi:hypothetical protein